MSFTVGHRAGARTLAKQTSSPTAQTTGPRSAFQLGGCQKGSGTNTRLPADGDRYQWFQGWQYPPRRFSRARLHRLHELIVDAQRSPLQLGHRRSREISAIGAVRWQARRLPLTLRVSPGPVPSRICNICQTMLQQRVSQEPSQNAGQVIIESFRVVPPCSAHSPTFMWH